MATIQERNKSFRILFCYHGKRYSFTLGEVPLKEAELTAANVDRLLLRLAQNFLHLPPGCDIVTFVRNDGVVPESNASAIASCCRASSSRRSVQCSGGSSPSR